MGVCSYLKLTFTVGRQTAVRIASGEVQSATAPAGIELTLPKENDRMTRRSCRLCVNNQAPVASGVSLEIYVAIICDSDVTVRAAC